jgi:hypothetical protein
VLDLFGELEPVTQRGDYTFKFNKNLGRPGWLRLTPAYSVRLVKDLITTLPGDVNVLDPFSGTATTGLVAAEHGNSARTFDINPFLIWVGNLKCDSYSSEIIEEISSAAQLAIDGVESSIDDANWQPPIFNIERWWAPHTLKVLAALRARLVEQFGETKESSQGGLVWIAFCRLIIETSSAAFNQQSMSFHDDVQHYEVEHVIELFRVILDSILTSASSKILGDARVMKIDAREIPPMEMTFGRVITSPPYPNRMSYIRELRPYMYWTKFLEEAKEAGELDWKAIGGTWGIASSRLSDWETKEEGLPPKIFDVYKAICSAESKNAKLLGTYVLKYFHDMHMHLRSIRGVLEHGAQLHYIVGNSTFFGNMVDTAGLLEDSFNILGYTSVKSSVIRKRNSKKELFEYNVSAIWP